MSVNPPSAVATDPLFLALQDDGLADRLRRRTETLHRQAERSGVLRDLLRGNADHSAYRLLLHNLLPVYAALELGLERHRADPLVGPLAQPGLYRAAALRADLAALSRLDPDAPLRHVAAAARYAARIDAVVAGDPPLLLAHAYVRYLGDLNGGQVLKRLLGRSLGLGPDSLSFYDFPAIADVAAFIPPYRAEFDRAGRALADAEALLEEAALAFELTIALSEEICRTDALSKGSAVGEPAKRRSPLETD